MGRAIAFRRAIFVSPGRAYMAANVMWYVGPFCGGSVEPSSCTLTDTALVATIRADSVVGRCRDTTDLHEVNL
jgi:hypothetical protein